MEQETQPLQRHEESLQPGPELLASLYDLPLGGHWSDVHRAMCRYWSDLAAAPDDARRRSLAELEAHMERTLRLLERAPSHAESWRDQLYRIPLPACVLDARGTLLETNERAQTLQSPLREQAPTLRRELHAIGDDPNVTAGAELELKGEQRQIYLRLLTQVGSESPLYLGVVATAPTAATGTDLLRHCVSILRADVRWMIWRAPVVAAATPCAPISRAASARWA